jgi:signal transduction histidine kinase/streptogramin lyase
MGLVEDGQEQFWVGARFGLWGISQLAAESTKPAGAIVTRRFATKEGLPCPEVNAVFQGQDGRLWVGADCGLYEFLKGEKRFRTWLDTKEMPDTRIWSFNEDESGNLWVGTANGAIRLARGGFTTYMETDGLSFRDVFHITESSAGEVMVYTRSRFESQTSYADRFDGSRFVSQKVAPRAFPRSDFDWWQGQIPIQDHQGEWWWPTRIGLFRFARANRLEELFNARPVAHYTVKDGLPDLFLRSIFEDHRGDIWISMGADINTKVVRWERATGKFHAYSEADGLPAKASVTTVCQDGAGNLWIGFEQGGVARYAEGRFTTFTGADFTGAEAIPEGEINDLFLDSKGRIWIASNSGGLGRIDDPLAQHPQGVVYTTAEGLASNSVFSIAEDRGNKYYVGTGRGLNYIDFDSGSVKLFTTADGLANDEVDSIFRDRRGAFWFGTSTGVSRLLPQAEARRAPAPIFINSVKITGDPQPVSAVGETDFGGFELAPNQNHIEIGFGSLSFAVGDLIRYQYRLDGADADWQPLTFHRTVNYANLAPGAYRFQVRAVNSEGVSSLTPATLEFRVLAPFWQRWWFISIIAALTAMAFYWLHRYRLAQRLEVERVRTRIASDLHDDIGANLTRIAILSEVAHSHLHGSDEKVDTPLSSIARISRESVASMSDIVWAINPQRDTLVDLVRRMRRFAGEISANRRIDIQFRAPETEDAMRLGADVRRDLFLIFKEAINNAARHSGGANVDIDFRPEGMWLVLKVSDDGKGFDTEGQYEGEGLQSMRRRAAKLGGEFHLTSIKGAGTHISVKAPRRRRSIPV